MIFVILCQASDLSSVIAEFLSSLKVMPPFAIVFVVTIFGMIVTTFTANAACATLLLPIAAELVCTQYHHQWQYFSNNRSELQGTQFGSANCGGPRRTTSLGDPNRPAYAWNPKRGTDLGRSHSALHLMIFWSMVDGGLNDSDLNSQL